MPEVRNPGYGIAVGGSLQDLDPKTLGNRLDRINHLGVGWVRFDIAWDRVQSQGPGSYDWAAYDRLAAEVQRRGLKALAVIAYTPRWARLSACSDTPKCSPRRAQDFAAFAAATVQHYQPYGIDHWEVWNEPNLTMFWRPVPNATKYMDLLRVTYSAIKAVQPNSTVIVGGLARAYRGGSNIPPTEFVRQLYALGARPYFDAIADHPYSSPVSPDSAQGLNAWRWLLDLREELVRAGDQHKLIWITEYGAPTNGPGREVALSQRGGQSEDDYVSESDQARILTAAVRLHRNARWLGPFFWYSDIDSGSEPGSSEFYGLVHSNGATKAAYGAYKREVSVR